MALCVLALAVVSCDGGRDRAASPFRPGIRFDPATARRGQRVGELVLDSIVARRAIVDSIAIGSAWFRGRLSLTGHTMLHPDADLRETERCFEADSSSATRMPRWTPDERRPWFCFANRAEAARMLDASGAPREGAPARIVIERFTIHRGMSDEVNVAWLVETSRER